MIQVIKGIHYKSLQPIAIEVVNGLIKSISNLEEPPAADLGMIAPGLVDLQVNGYFGVDFNAPSITVESIIHLTELLLAQGVTLYFPTVITNSKTNITHLLSRIAQACEKSKLVSTCIGGIHLEGPFISPQQGPLGAHDKQYVCAPDWELFKQFNEASGYRIKIITLSPEWPEAAAFTRKCVANDILVSIGHTAATSDEIAAVVDAGAGMSTHLGNGVHQLLPRHPNYIWDQLADERLAAGFISDGYHIPAAVIKVILKMKGQNAVLVSDSVSLAGMPAGSYFTPVGGHVVLTSDGKLHLADRPDVLAGSVQPQLQGIQKLYVQGLCSMAEAWDLASSNPARLINTSSLPALTKGAAADFVLMKYDQQRITIAQTYKRGVQVYVNEHLTSA